MVSLLQRKIGTVVTSWSILKWHTYLPIEVIVKTLGTSAHPFCCGLFQQYNLDQLSTLTYEYQCLQQFVTEGFSHTATTNHPKTTFPSRTAKTPKLCKKRHVAELWNRALWVRSNAQGLLVLCQASPKKIDELNRSMHTLKHWSWMKVMPSCIAEWISPKHTQISQFFQRVLLAVPVRQTHVSVWSHETYPHPLSAPCGPLYRASVSESYTPSTVCFPTLAAG